jgi:predicted PurR-regulated permease PerM
VSQQLPAGTRPRIPGWPIAAALALLFLFLYYVRQVLLPFIVAAALGFLLTPLVDGLHRRLKVLPRWSAAIFVYILVLAVLAGLAYYVGPVLAADTGELAAGLPQALHRFIGLAAVDGKIPLLGQSVDADTLVQTISSRIRSFLLSDGGFRIAATGISVAFGLLLSLVLLVWFLISGKELHRSALWLVPPEYRDEVHRLAAKIAPVLRRYIVGLMIVVSYVAVTVWIILSWVFATPHAPLTAVVVGFLELVPMIGPLTSMVLLGLTALQAGSVAAAIGLGIFAILLRLSIDQLVGPLVLGRATYLHPVVIIFAFLSGAIFLGVLGLLLAVPVAATIKIVLTHYYEEEVVS